MKVILSNKAYLKPDDKLRERLEKNLTYQVFEPHSKTSIPKLVLHYGLVARGTYWLPVSRVDLLQGYDVEYIDKRTNLPETFPEPKFKLREDQQEIFDEADDSCIINAKPGFGKTILALALAWKLGQKTLVVCTTTAIRDMWISEVRKWFDIEPGIIGSGMFDHESPITIGNIQTLAKHGVKLADQFGLMIVDEMHHTPASTFTKLLMESKARYKIGLSGTLKRKDGLECLFKDFFGMKVFIPEVANTIAPTIHLYDTDVEISGNQMIPWANKVNAVMENPVYRKHMLALTNCYISMGHKVIVVSDRIEFLKYIHEHAKGRSALFIGETATEDRVQLQKDMSDGKLDLFCASQNIFSEGISQNELSCMILGSPIGDNESLVEQLAGRIMRQAEGKLDPILVDSKLNGWTGTRHRRARTSIYGKNGWQCIPMTIPKLVALNKNSFAKLLDFKV
ncbi:putative ATP-dependent helicase [Vibrio phage Athena]|uniref:Putative ATP-dependent helicase n=7 Tax=Thalassavirus TaxID=2948922 RepID=A0A6M4ES43_9CAUD|nr:putative ATP-dependent helicase [Vibrio phage Thalassa]YP_010105641.1 putative ATP-dependent helicase [Vibrio phage Bennett]YP_010105835.1 putative ATP-dependent helicase [Vibrio phage Chester]YP_010108286.1 putative ATP-dependent helicase [Vibrio phage Cody]YP_010108479.1 putative ATP-dependent helicase [Vibrio phage Quinn]YP_010108675.1 putative ATP-dependent helicase [Vibrio phage Athena]YP_010114220.1 putative ATP-dependent helicase [Vibrio phage Gary]QIG66171.1 putative ATP-dependent